MAQVRGRCSFPALVHIEVRFAGYAAGLIAVVEGAVVGFKNVVRGTALIEQGEELVP